MQELELVPNLVQLESQQTPRKLAMTERSKQDFLRNLCHLTMATYIMGGGASFAFICLQQKKNTKCFISMQNMQHVELPIGFVFIFVFVIVIVFILKLE